MQDQQNTAGIAIIDLPKVEAIALDFRPKFLADLQEISEADLKASVQEALKYRAPETSDKAEIKAAIKTIDDRRKAFKNWKVQINKTTDKWTAPFKGAQAWIKDEGGQQADLALSAEKHLQTQQDKLEAQLQAIVNQRNEELCQGLVGYGFELVAGQRVLRYAGNQTLAIDSLHKMTQADVDAVCDAHDAWVASEQEAQEKRRQQAVKIRELLAKTFRLDVVPALQEADAQRAEEFYATILQSYGDDYVATEADLEAVSRLEFQREFQPTPPPAVAQYPLAPEEAVAPEDAQPSTQEVRGNFENSRGSVVFKESEGGSFVVSQPAIQSEEAQAANQEPVEAITSAAEDVVLQPEFEESTTQFEEPTAEEIAIKEAEQKRLDKLRAEFSAIALKSRVKIGNHGSCIIFDNPDLEAFVDVNDMFSHSGHSGSDAYKYYGGILLCESVINQSVAEQIVARWNAMAPPRKK